MVKKNDEYELESRTYRNDETGGFYCPDEPDKEKRGDRLGPKSYVGGKGDRIPRKTAEALGLVKPAPKKKTGTKKATNKAAAGRTSKKDPKKAADEPVGS